MTNETSTEKNGRRSTDDNNIAEQVISTEQEKEDTVHADGTPPEAHHEVRATMPLLFGITSIVCSVFAVIGVLLGVLALAQARRVNVSAEQHKVRVARICGAIGIVLSIVLCAVEGFVAFQAWQSSLQGAQTDVSSVVQTLPSRDTSSSSTTEHQTQPAENTQTGQEGAVMAATDALLEQVLQPSDEIKAHIIEAYDTDVTSPIGVGLNQVGIDTTSYVNWLTDKADYSVESIQVYDTAAFVTVNLDVYNAVDVLNDYSERLNKQVSSKGELDEKAYQQALNEAMDTAQRETTPFYITMSLVDNTWEAQPSSRSSLLYTLYGADLSQIFWS